MPADKRSYQDEAGAYIVQDRSNQIELERLYIQDKMLTTGMGGVLAEQEHPESLRRVLDVGCGTGGWLIETAKAYPQIELLVGVDISPAMIAFAREKAQEAGVANRVEFQVGDSLRMLEFPPSFFDLVNQRSCMSYIRTWEWWKLLLEYRRVVQPEGIIRITEPSLGAEMSNCPALTRFYHFLVQTFERAGYFFEPDADSILNHLVSLMEKHGISEIHTRLHLMEFRAGTPQGERSIEDGKRLLQTMDPFLRKWMRLPDDYEETRQQALLEMQRPDFIAHAKMLTAWGKPGDRPVFTARKV